MSFDFRKWIQEQSGDYTKDFSDPDHLKLITDYAIAEVNFYPIENDAEVVEFRIENNRDHNVEFFLHFQAVDEDHAEGLFKEMTDALVALKEKKNEEILLCCSSALTTSFFAEQLNKAAETLHMNYHFSAVDVNSVYQSAIGKSAVLLAPQIGFMVRKLQEVMTDQLILTIPARVFGTYDAGACIRFVEDNLNAYRAKKKAVKAPQDIMSSGRLLVIAVSSTSVHEPKIYYRIYDHGKAVLNQTVIKRKLTLRDVEDVIDTQVCSCSGEVDADAICIAVPGSVHQGHLDMHKNDRFDFQNGEKNNFDIVSYLNRKYAVPVYVIHNAKAAVLGWQKEHPEYQNVCFFSTPRGSVYGGQGAMVNGKLLEGRRHSAGETRYVADHFNYSHSLHFSGYNPDDMKEVVVKTLLMDIAVLDPEAICIRCELTPDMEALKQELIKNDMPADHIPDLFYIDDFYEYILPGEAEWCALMDKQN